MEEKNMDSGEVTTGIVKIEDMTLDETQLAEQLYSSAGLDPIIDAGIIDYDKKIQKENKIINKVFGIRETDVKGYGEAVAKRVAFAVYSQLNRQYGGKVGDLRSYILSLEDERNRANTRYDDLMGRVIGILGDEYKELRSDSREFMEKLTKTLGEDLKDSKIDQAALAERLADIDGLRAQISDLNQENEQIREKYETEVSRLINDQQEKTAEFESRIAELNREVERVREEYESQLSGLKSTHREEVDQLQLNITGLGAQIEGLESEKGILINDLQQLQSDYDELKNGIKEITDNAPEEQIGVKLSENLYNFLLEDSKVPDMVIDGVGKFINFKKYLGESAERGVKEICVRLEHLLDKSR